MNPTARSLLALAVISFCAGCLHTRPPQPVLAAGALAPSPRLLIGRILSVDAAEKFAFVDLAADAPAGALVDGTELHVRTLDLRDTGRILASRYVRGRTLGAKIVAGQPSPGDEVVWLAP